MKTYAIEAPRAQLAQRLRKHGWKLNKDTAHNLKGPWVKDRLVANFLIDSNLLCIQRIRFSRRLWEIKNRVLVS